MDQLLGPGIRLMRRLRVGGKFLAMAVLLLIPMSITSAGSMAGDTRQLRVASDERDGLVMIRPLMLVTGELSLLRIIVARGATATGSTTSALDVDLQASLARTDAADRAVGGRLGTRADWATLRPALVTLGLERAGARSATGPGPTAEELRTAETATITLIGRVADLSQLILDPQLDSYHTMIALVDRVPSIMECAAAVAERTDPARTSDLTDIADLSGRLSTDLASASAATHWPAYEGRIRRAAGPLQVAAPRFFADLSAAGRATADRSAADLTSIRSADAMITAAVGLTDGLAGALDVLLDRRQQALSTDRIEPVLLALAALAAGGYFLLGLLRGTTADIRRVVADVSVVTEATMELAPPLTGPDEFAQMSRAVAFARNRLTTLLGTLRHQATHDELTSLANRTLFVERLTDALTEPGHRVGVLVIDLDGFKDVNDSFGHGIGDRMLHIIGVRFEQAVPAGDVVARLGADQFGVLLIDVGPSGERLAGIVEALRSALLPPIDLDGRRLQVQASIGIATSGPDAAEPGSVAPDGLATDLMRNADVAVHVAKTSGKGRVARFEPAMHEETRLRTELSFELVHAIEQDRLFVLYQPIVDLDTESVTGVEALLRWNHPTRGLISPTVFVPLAEATGLIVPIGRWVLEQAVRQLGDWQREFPAAEPLSMDINLSPGQLTDPGLAGDVLTLIAETGVDPASIVLEITESALVHDVESALRRLHQLAAVGVRLALDDFGTGYSSLSYLRRLPVTILKIDKSFLTDEVSAGREQRRAADVLLRGIVQLGTGLGMDVVAEGVETRAQVTRLEQAGCHLGQGFLWSRPVPPDAIRDLLRGTAVLGGRMPAQRSAIAVDPPVSPS
jgi:diguanylate cyclase (GGDEF)-like protein